MTKKFYVVLAFILLILVGIALLGLRSDIFLKKTIDDFTLKIENEDIDDVSLTIYYMSPYTLTTIPLSVNEFINSDSVNKIVVNGDRLEDYIHLFKEINSDNLIKVEKKSSYLNVRLYYVLESNKNGKLLDVAMWGSGENNSIFVNGIEVEENSILYDAIIPFLPEESAEELKLFIKNEGRFEF